MSVPPHKETVNQLLKILNYKRDFRMIYGDRTCIADAVKIMSNKLDAVFAKQKPTVNRNDMLCVRKAIATLVDVALTKAITPYIRDLSLAFSRLAYNWNVNLTCNKEIEREILVLKQLIETHLSLVGAISVMRALLVKFGDLTKYMPPAFELSKHYLLTLDGGESDGSKSTS